MRRKSRYPSSAPLGNEKSWQSADENFDQSVSAPITAQRRAMVQFV